MSAVDAAFRTAVAAMHARLDDWASAVHAVGASESAGPEAPDDPRLEAAEEEFEAAVVEFHRAAAPVLGLEPAGDGAEDADLEVEELALHLLVGVAEDAEDPPRDAGTMVHEAGERLVAQLVAAGYEVPAWQFGCEIELLLDDDDE